MLYVHARIDLRKDLVGLVPGRDVSDIDREAGSLENFHGGVLDVHEIVGPDPQVLGRHKEERLVAAERPAQDAPKLMLPEGGLSLIDARTPMSPVFTGTLEPHRVDISFAQ
jgi:hypothetical protein